MSKSEYNESEKLREIRALDHDPRANALGYDAYSVQSQSKAGWLTFRHLDSESNPDAWITASFWYDLEAFGAAEHTKR